MDDVDHPLDDQAHSEHVDLSLVVVRLQKVHLGEVHSAGLWKEGLEELHNEGQRDALSLWGACRSELALVHAVNVEGDPVRLSLAAVEEVLVNLFLNLRQALGKAEARVVPGDFVLLDHLYLLRLIGADAEVDDVLKAEAWLAVVARN